MARALLILSLAVLGALLLSGCILFPNGLPTPGGKSTPNTSIRDQQTEPILNASDYNSSFNQSNLNYTSPDDNSTWSENLSSPANESEPDPTSINASANSSLNATPSSLSLVFYDVGQADATLIRTGNFTLLLDTGSAASADSLARSLSRQDLTHLDVVAISRWDEAKLGGLDALMRRFSIGEIWIPGPAPDTPAFRYATLAIEQSDAPVRSLGAGDRLRYGDLALEVFNPPQHPFSTSTEANSLVMRLWYHGFCAFFPGDLQEAQEAPLLTSLGTQTCQLYKWPYHGRGSSTTSLIVDKLQPTDVVISVGSNTDGLPSPTTLTRLNISERTVWRTDTGGDICVGVNATGYVQINASRQR